jgi:predicted HAD superfamily Cof-like phosphohydrolase
MGNIVEQIRGDNRPYCQDGWGEPYFTETLGDPFLAQVDAGRDAGAVNGGGENATPTIPPSLIRGLDYAFLQVREFHQAFDHPIADHPKLMDYTRACIRAKWMREELEEFLDVEKQTIVDQCDAMLDLIYFALGTLVEIGVLPQSLMDIVQHANMSKLHNIDGVLTVVKNDLGKVQKPEGWVAPEPLLSAEVSRQHEAGLLSALAA